MCLIRSTRTPHHQANYISGIRMPGPHATKCLWVLLVATTVLGLGILQQSVLQELASSPVKCPVFDNWLLRLALTTTTSVRVQELGLLSLLLPTKSLAASAPTIPALVAVCWSPRLNVGIDALNTHSVCRDSGSQSTACHLNGNASMPPQPEPALSKTRRRREINGPNRRYYSLQMITF